MISGKNVSMTIVFLLISIILLIISSFGVFDTVESIVSRVKYYLVNDINTHLSFWGDFIDTYKYISQIKEENQKLNNEIITIKSELVNTKMLLDEKTKECTQINQDFSRQYNLTPALVIGYDRYNFGLLTLNKGYADGIKVGDNVVVKNFLIGKVIKVSKYTSLLETIVSPSSRVSVSNLKGAKGILVSENGNDLIIKEVLVDSEVNLKDKFITTGIDDDIIYGLYVGEVESIDLKSSKTTKTIHLKNEIKFNNLDKVFILNNGNFNN